MRGLRFSSCSWKRSPIDAAAITQSGMLMKKIQRQLAYSERTPPSVGPTTEEMPQTLAV